MLNGLKRGYARYLLLSAILVTVLVCVYYVNYGSGIVSTKDLVSKLARKSGESEGGEPPPAPGPPPLSPAARVQNTEERNNNDNNNNVESNEIEPTQGVDLWSEPDADPSFCPRMKEATTNVNTVDQFQQFEFQVSFICTFTFKTNSCFFY